MANFQVLVKQEGRWHGRLRPVAIDHIVFFRPRLKDDPTKHYHSQAGKALPAIPFGVLAAIGSVGTHIVPLLPAIVRGSDAPALLAAAQAQLAPDEYLVADRGFWLRHVAVGHPLKLSAAEAHAAFRERWPVEQLPQTAKQLLGAHRHASRVFGADARQRLPEVALLSGSLLMYLAATQPAQSTGFLDQTPRPTTGRLRRLLARHQFSEDWPLLEHFHKKNAVTAHLPKGITAHRRMPGDVRFQSAPT